MKITNNVKKVVVGGVVSSVLIPTSAFAGTWDATPSKSNFTFNRNIGPTYVYNAEVRSGYANGGNPTTEIKVNYAPGGCSILTKTTITANLTSEVTGYTSRETRYKDTYYSDDTSMILTFDEYITPGNLNLTISSKCVGGTTPLDQTIYDAGDVLSPDTTSKCDSHWLDTDCWGY
jgi:hypothetical protein